MKNTIITFLLITTVILSFLLLKSKNENQEAKKVITEIKQNLEEAKDELKAKTSKLKHEICKCP